MTTTPVKNPRPVMTEYEDGRRTHCRTTRNALVCAARALLHNRHEYCTVWVGQTLIARVRRYRNDQNDRSPVWTLGTSTAPLQRVDILYYPGYLDITPPVTPRSLDCSRVSNKDIAFPEVPSA